MDFSNSVSTFSPLTSSEEDHFGLLSTPVPASNGTGSAWFNICLVGGYLVIIIIGITANLMVLMVTLNSQWRRIGNRALSTMNTYIINLASADLFYIFGGIFWVIANMDSRGWLFGEMGCRVVVSLDIMTMHVGSYILTTMTVERYIAIVFPMASFRIRNVTFARRICAIIWLSAIGLAFPVILGARQTSHEKDGKPYMVCGELIYSKIERNRYFISVCTITFVIPSIVMLIFYVKMFTIISYTIRESRPSNSVTRQLRKSSRRAAKIVFLIVAVYWCCYTPFWLNQVLTMYTPNSSLLRGNIMGLVTLLLSYLNSMVNPFLYTLLPPTQNLCNRIRVQYKKLVKTNKWVFL